MDKPYEISVDIETTGLDYFKDNLVSVALASSEKDTVFLTKDQLLNEAKILEYLADESIPKIFHNANFDLKFLEKAGVQIKGVILDTLIMAQLINENESLKLKELVKKYLGVEALTAERALNRWLEDNKLKKDSISKAPLEILAAYNIEDAVNTIILKKIFLKRLKEISDTQSGKFKFKRTVLDYFTQEAMPIERVLYQMETQGVNVDIENLNRLKIEYEKKVNDAVTKLNELCYNEIKEIENAAYEVLVDCRKSERGKAAVKRPEFNWASSQDVGALFFDKLNLSKYLPNAKTKTGLWQCSKHIFLQALEVSNLPPTPKEACKLYLEILNSRKKVTTDIGSEEKGLMSLIHGGKVYPSFKQISPDSRDKGKRTEASGTVTGRLSSARPNFQNLQKFAKPFFIPSGGDKVFLSFDYSQIELRLAAHMSKDEKMLAAFNSDIDLHLETAKTITGDPGLTKEKDYKWRQVGKTTNFLLIFNGSAKRLMDQLSEQAQIKITFEEAKQYREAFFETYPGYKKYLNDSRDFMQRHLFVCSPFGRVRRLPDLKYKPFLDYRNETLSGPYVTELEQRLAQLPPKQRNYYNSDKGKYESLSLFGFTKRLVLHAHNQGFNMPIQSAAASIVKRAMLKLYNEGFKVVNQVHDEVVVEVNRDDAEKLRPRIQHILENVVKLSVPLLVEWKVKGHL